MSFSAEAAQDCPGGSWNMAVVRRAISPRYCPVKRKVLVNISAHEDAAQYL